MKYLSSPKKVLIETVIGLWKKAKRGVGPKIENKKSARLGIETEDNSAGMILNSYTCNC